MQCGICGKDYIALGVHLRHKHQVSPAEYREEYGLMKTEPLVAPELSTLLSKSQKARMQDPEYLAEVQETCRANARKNFSIDHEMSEAGKAKTSKLSRERAEAYLRSKAGEVGAILESKKTILDVRKAIGMGANAVKGIAALGLVAIDKDEAKRVRDERAKATHRAKAAERVRKVEPYLNTTRSAAEMCRLSGITVRTYKNWLAAGLIARHPNGRGPRP